MTGGTPAEPLPMAWLGRTSTLYMQDPKASLRRQLDAAQAKLPPACVITRYYWDIESGALDLAERGQGSEHEMFPDIGIPRDGGVADLVDDAKGHGFAAVICEEIDRTARDSLASLMLEKELENAGVPLFASDEPIDIEGMNENTILVRRIKQGIAEHFRFQLRKRAWGGMRIHTLDGWNTGSPPYGYAGQKFPHPAPAKRAMGLTKTRLILDPVPAAAVAQIFTWRVYDKLGVTTITGRLNADHVTYPPPKGDTWTEQGVYAILRNPKYTGYMVWNRVRKIPSGKKKKQRRPNPPEKWIWSQAESHPPIITREEFDAAQQVTRSRASTAGDPGAPAHPLARRSYELRSRIRHRDCKRRMHGTTRAAGTYYACPHDVNNPRHAAACPDHHKTVFVREDTLITFVCQFLAQRVLGPERAALLAAQIPASAAAQQARTENKRARLVTELKRIDNSQKSQILQIDTLPADPADSAAQAMRRRCNERFAELHTERDQVQAQLDALTGPGDQAGDPSLLGILPIMTARLDKLSPRARAAIYNAIDLQLVYSKDKNQVTIYATITDRTPQALTALINDSEPPAPAGTSTPPATTTHPQSSDSQHAPIRAKNLTNSG